jgi:hypothetical protein
MFAPGWHAIRNDGLERRAGRELPLVPDFMLGDTELIPAIPL